MKKILLGFIFILGLLISLGGLIVLGIGLMVLGIWLWPGKRKRKNSNQQNSEPIWQKTDRESLYFEGDMSSSSTDSSKL